MRVSGQPVVIYKTTPITLLGGTDNPMISGLAMSWLTVDTMGMLPQSIIGAAR